ncbi:hypothetical protein RJ55_03562 [Drechmeria coniospora]|nr:hypothetical protein RJ55_03562 [Drechmeria coniospora]
MTLRYEAPAGPRTANSSSPTRLGSSNSTSDKSFPSAANGIRLVSANNAPMLAAASGHHHSLATFERHGENREAAKPSASFDFLPSVNFDDLHTSIESASTDLKLTPFSSPTRGASIADPTPSANMNLAERPAVAPAAAQGRAVNPPPTSWSARAASIVRRPSASSRQPSSSSNLSSASASLEAAMPAVAARGRRQSHYPPVSNANMMAKPPRKSDTDLSTRNQPAHRPGLLAERGHRGSHSRRSIDGAAMTPPDMSRRLANSRATKAKSVQPPMRLSQANLLSNLTPEHNRLPTLAQGSPLVAGKGSTPSSGGKRASLIPGNTPHGSHATGLGARTVSPTDTRRMKRLSTVPPSQSLNLLPGVPPPPPVARNARAESRSPSMIPRRTPATPSSARTTPDAANRKSYGSVQSVGSATSSNPLRTSAGSFQPRLPVSASTSRLPPPKHTVVHNPLPADDEEYVPPVPAIPKAFESPKGSPGDPYFADKKKPGLGAVDVLGFHSNSAGSISMPVHPEPTKSQQRHGARKSSVLPSNADEKKGTRPGKQLPPLRLPPLNMGPLHLPPKPPAALSQDDTGSGPNPRSPPPRRQPKTPTTPMTASKSSFFAKGKYDETMELPPPRSSTSIHRTHRLTPTPPDLYSSDSSANLSEANQKPTMSPFLSSSLPKGGFEHALLKRSKTGADYVTLTGHVFEDRAQTKPAGPREPTADRLAASPPPPGSAPGEPEAPPSKPMVRMPSVSRKQGNANGATFAPGDAANKSAVPYYPQNNSIPPPRFTASATTGSLSAAKPPIPSPAVASSNGGYLESRRRKDSAASLTTNLASQERARGDTWASKEAADSNTVPVTRNPVIAPKVMKPRTSMGALRATLYSAKDLDRDDVVAEEEMRKLGSRRKETEVAAKALDALRERATPKERVSPHEAVRIAMLNIYERGEIVDFGDVYFCGTQNARKVVGDVQSDAPNFGYDDERGDYTIVPGDHLAYRYEIVDVLGKGSFGQVVRCIDHKLGVLVAVKIIRNKKRFHQQALVEVNILQKLREWDPKNRHSMVNFTQHFYFRGHLCISTELLDMNLYEFIKAHGFRGFSLRIIRRFTKQMLSSLMLLKQRRVIHCDLKPENILLRHPLHSEIKVIDFGSSCFEQEKVYTYIQSRFYRSPEVILGMQYGLPIDMWSVGCILAELYTGVPIFPGENEQEQLACIMEVFGPPEKHLIEKSTRKKLFFDSMGKPRLTVSSKGRRRRPSSKTLQQVLRCDDDSFVDFLSRCMRWDPDRRLKPEDAVRHEFITGQKPVMVPRLPTRENSPVKRANTVSAPRPLPDPPAPMGKAFLHPSRTGMTPLRVVSGASRRASGATGATASSMSKRTSAGGSGGGGGGGFSGLPRAAGRIVSGKQDLAAAAAGASMAMNRRP